MSRKPNKRRTINSNRPALTEHEEENAKYDALLQDLGAYDGDMTLQEKRDYYGALMASMGEANVNSSSPIIICESPVSDHPAEVPAVANNQSHCLLSENESPTVPAHSRLQTSYGSLPEISSSPPPLEDSPISIRPRRRNCFANGMNGSLSTANPQTVLVAEIEDSDQDSSIRARDTEATCSAYQKKSANDTPVPEASALDVKNRLAAFRSMLEKKENTGGTVVLITPKELINLDIDSIPEPCSSVSLTGPIVQEEIQKLRKQLQAKRMPLNPESLSYDEQVELISKQKKPVKHVIYSKEVKNSSFAKSWDLENDLCEEFETDGQSRAVELETNRTVEMLRKSTRKQTTSVVRNLKTGTESSDDDFIVTKKARVKKGVKENTAASKKTHDTDDENFDVGNEEWLIAEHTAQKRSTSQYQQRANSRKMDRPKKNIKTGHPNTKNGLRTSFVPQSKLTEKVSGEIQPEQSAENSSSLFETVRCGGVDVEELIGRPNLPQQVRERILTSLISCAYCTKPFLGSNITGKMEHEKTCHLNQSFPSDKMTDSVENGDLRNQSQKVNVKQNRREETERDGTVENLDVQDLRTSSPVLAKRSRTKK